MLTPQQLQRLPQRLIRAIEEMEADILSDICRRLRLSGAVTETALHQIRMLAERGYSQAYIEKCIRQMLEIGREEIDAMFQEAVESNEAFLKKALDKSDITVPARDWRGALDSQVEAIRRQTHDEFRNITQSMGFAIRTGGKPKFYKAGEVYQRVMDRVTLEVISGTTDYNAAVRRAVTELAESGLQYVNYASGHRDHADVAVRRAVMTGMSQCAGRMSENAMKLLDTRYVETEAHTGARDIDGPKGWENHKKWQGRWFYWSRGGEPDPLGKYPDFEKSTGYGDVQGLQGANCRHTFFAVIPGLDEPNYTEKELSEIDPPPFEYEGKLYNAFAARQKQREYERKMRYCKRQMTAHKAAGNTEDYDHYKARLAKLSSEYKEFSAKAKLPLQMERARVDRADPDSVKRAADWKEFKEYRSILGENAPKTFAKFQDLKYNDSEKWAQLKTLKRQTVVVENAPCVTTPKKYTEFFLKPGAKHADDFFNVGYTQDNPLQLRYDMARQFDMEKAVKFETDKTGVSTFNIYMSLGVNEIKRFRTCWQVDVGAEKPRIITAFRDDKE